MAEKRDYYEILGISKDADDAAIKRAFRKAAKENHPDLHPGDKAAEARFKEINEAYEVLSDSEKRARYDQYGHAGVDPNFGAGGGYGGAGFEDFDLGSIFENFFGGGMGGSAQRRNGPQRGSSLQVNLTLSFEEAAFGCEKDITVDRVEQCPQCSGSGAKAGTHAETCSTCRGTGQVRTTQRSPFGTFATTAPCRDCGGTGKIIKEPCAECRGSGQVRKRRTIHVKIPAGIDEGQQLPLRGEGNRGLNGGPSGDILVSIRIRPHPLFERQGTSVLCDVPITFAQACLGAELEVPTLDGKVKYQMPEGTQEGTTFRLRGKGIPVLGRTGRGDQYVTVHIEVPKNLNQKQKELLRQFDNAVGDQNHNRRQSFFEKIKNVFEGD